MRRTSMLLRGIQTRHPTDRAAADLRLRAHLHQTRLSVELPNC